MTWQDAIQVVSTVFAGIGMWFVFDLIREFKQFKTESKRDITNLQRERDLFTQLVRGSELSMKSRVLELNSALETNKTHVERGLGIIDNELARIRMSIDRANEKAQRFDDFMKTALKLSHAINEKQKQLEKEFLSMRATITKQS